MRADIWYGIKKAIFNKYFIVICFLGIVIAIMHSYEAISTYSDISQSIQYYSSKEQNPHASITNAFTMWIGWDQKNKYSKLLYRILPLISVLPYCWSYSKEKKIGIANKNIVQNGKWKYHFSKYTSVFISSGLVMAIPLIINFLTILLFIPPIYPDSVYDIYYGIFSCNFMADMFYMHPFVYVGIFIALSFIYCGLFGCLGYAISVFLPNRILSVSFPIVAVLLTEHIKNRVLEDNAIQRNNFSPYSFLCPAKSLNTNYKIVCLEIVMLFLITFFGPVLKYKLKGTAVNRSDKNEA